MKDHTLVLSESKIIISGLSLVLKQNSIIPVVKSGTIPGYELTLDMDEIYAVSYTHLTLPTNREV